MNRFGIASTLICGLMFLGCGDDDDDAAFGQDGGRDGGKSEAPTRDASSAAGNARDAGTRRDAVDPSPKCPTGECNLLDWAACPQGEGCVFTRVDGGPSAPSCAAVGSGADGDACMQSSDCAAGLDCTAFDGSGQCRNYCCELSATENCPRGQFCRLSLAADQRAAKVGLCDSCDGCDPLDLGSCGAGLSCYPLPGSTKCTACLPPGKSEPGVQCKVSTECALGSACFRLADQSARCVELCRLESDHVCKQSGTRCREVAAAGLPAGAGLCL